MTKRFCILILAVIISFSAYSGNGNWEDGKFSMFVHFGLYSELGGVWKGKPVRDGYSEQIQSFAKISDNDYANVATNFNPQKFNADSIVNLAIEAGMHSVVVTAKHHDGFSIYDTKFSDFDIIDATPYGRDLLKEISEACAKRGINFGIYFSLVDWHFPYSVPTTPHNADIATPKHHEFNLNQVRELLTNYGKVSELWFDMGSLSAQQSNELYALVKSLQPNCMVSSRLGNETGDFAVMADNRLPEYRIGLPWQTAASIYNETWGYRSWQKYAPLNEKIDEKIATLVKVVSHGGNYLLNIGPRGDGSITEHEQAVLRGVGEFVNRYSSAIYATKANPYRESFKWGEITAKDNVLYLFVNNYPENGIIKLGNLKSKLLSAQSYDKSTNLNFKFQNNELEINLPELKTDHGYYVVRLTFDSPVELLPEIAEGNLTAENSEKTYGVSSLDYYASRRSLVRYDWTFKTENANSTIYYPSIFDGDSLCYNSGNGEQLIILNGKPCADEIANIATGSAEMIKESYSKPYESLGGPFRAKSFDVRSRSASKTATTFDFADKSSVIYTAKYNSENETELRLMRISMADGISVSLNDEVIYSQIGVQRKNQKYCYVLMPFKQGENDVEIIWHKRTAGKILCEAKLINEGVEFRKMSLPKITADKNGLCQIRLSNSKSLPANTEFDLREFVIKY